MKRILTLSLLFVSLSSLAMATIKVETETWFDGNTVVTTNSNPLLNPGGQFFIGRAYFTLIGDLGTDFYGDPIKERVTFDLANATATGAAGIVKYAYFDFNLFKTAYTSITGGQTNTAKLNSIVFSAGLVPVYFGNISFWSYPLPIKDASELYSPVNYNYGVNTTNSKQTNMVLQTNYSGIKPTGSADFGFTLSGKLLPIEGLTSSLISYYLQILNGDGYKNLDNNNGAPYVNGATNWNNFAYQGSIFLSPLEGTLIGGTYRYVGLDDTSSFNTENSFALIADAKNVMGIPVDFSFEYVNESVTNKAYSFQPSSVTGYSGFKNDFNGVVYSVTLGYGFMDWAIEPVIRYDFFNPNTITTNNKDVSGSILYAGASIKLDANNLTMKPLVGFYLTENGAPSKNYLVWLEFAYKLNFTVWQ